MKFFGYRDSCGRVCYIVSGLGGLYHCTNLVSDFILDNLCFLIPCVCSLQGMP